MDDDRLVVKTVMVDWTETEQEDDLPGGGSITSLTGADVRFLL